MTNTFPPASGEPNEGQQPGQQPGQNPQQPQQQPMQPPQGQWQQPMPPQQPMQPQQPQPYGAPAFPQQNTQWQQPIQAPNMMPQNNPYARQVGKPNTYLIPNILVTIFCCLFTGIVGVVYSNKCENAYQSGDMVEAMESAKIARTWFYVSLGIGLFLWLGWLFSFIVLLLIGDTYSGYGY